MKNPKHIHNLKKPNNLIKENFLNLMKGIHQNSQISIMLNDKTLEAFSFNSECLLSIASKVPVSTVNTRRKKGICIRRIKTVIIL